MKLSEFPGYRRRQRRAVRRPRPRSHEGAVAEAVKIFKPYVVRREGGGCQVLFPLSALDQIVERVVRVALRGR